MDRFIIKKRKREESEGTVSVRESDSLDVTKLAEEFASRSDIRRRLFGNWA